MFGLRPEASAGLKVAWGVMFCIAVVAIASAGLYTIHKGRVDVKHELVEVQITNHMSAGEVKQIWGTIDPDGLIPGEQISPGLEGLLCYPRSDNKGWVAFFCAQPGIMTAE